MTFSSFLHKILPQVEPYWEYSTPPPGTMAAGLFFLLLIFFGPSRLPELGKSLGKGIQEFKKASKELTDSVKEG